MQRSHNVAIPVHTNHSGALGHQAFDALAMPDKMYKALRELVRVNAVQVAERQLEQRQKTSKEQSNGWEAREERESVGMLAIGGSDKWHPNTISIGRQIVRQTGQTLDKDFTLTCLGTLQVILAQTHCTRLGNHDELLVGTQCHTVGKEQFIQQHLAYILRSVIFE